MGSMRFSSTPAPARSRRTLRRLASAVALAAGLAVAVAGCSASGDPASSAPTTAAAKPTGSGPVNVLYAGSLVDLMQKQIGPGFEAATGYTFSGVSGGSSGLATQIKGKVNAADVFISAAPAVNDTLKGEANGDWVTWYATYASSALVLGYNPKSKFAAALKSKPWYEVITEPGILLGRTDPATDPKGKLTVQALNQAATDHSMPALGTIATSTSNVFPEETLVGRLQAGQLDAGFFYSSEASAAGFPTVPLTGIDLKAVYTITVLNRAPHPAAAEAFVKYFLGPQGQAALKKDAFTLTTPATATGTGVPASLHSVIHTP